MNFSQLRYFQAVAEYENISKAAARLFISQPALSKTIKNLENELGVSLFDRTPNTMTLNNAGKIMLEFANNVLSDYEDLQNRLFHYSDVDSHIIRFVSSNVVILRRIVPLFLSTYPNIPIETTTCKATQLEPLLVTGAADIGFTNSNLQNPLLTCMPFYEQDLLISLPKNHPLAQKQELTLFDLEGQTFLRYHYPTAEEGESLIISHLLQKLKDLGIKIHVIYQPDMALYTEMLAITNYWGLTNSRSSMSRNIATRVCLPLNDKSIRITDYIVYPKKRGPRTQFFLSWLYSHLQDTML